VSCGGDNPTESPGDAGLTPPQGCELTAPPEGWAYPAGPYGTALGDIVEDFSFEDCDLNPVRFGDVLSQSSLTLFNVGAGWCEPCIEETEDLDATIFREYCDDGLRVVQVLFQNERNERADAVFCEQWKERYGLSFPVLIDPLFETNKFFDSAQTPLNILVNPQGEIVYFETGTPAFDLPEQIEGLLGL
jgi:peroxiredoxin